MQLRRKRFDKPDEVRTVEKASIELVNLGEAVIGRTVFEPGLRWSELRGLEGRRTLAGLVREETR